MSFMVNTIVESKYSSINDHIQYLSQYLNDHESIDIDYIIDTMESITDDFYIETVISNENIISRLFINIIDGLISYINKVKNNFKYTFKTDKDIFELDLYHQKHKIAVHQVLKLKYTDVAAVMVMNSPSTIVPLKSLQTIVKYDNMMNIESINNSIVTHLKQLYKLISGEFYDDIEKQIKNYPIKLSLGPEVKKYVSEVLNPIIKDIAFGKMFQSMNEFRECDYICMTNQDIIRNAKKSFEKIKDISKSVEIFKNQTLYNIDQFNNKRKLVDSLKRLANYIYNIGKYYEAYGMLCKLYTQHEHHICSIFEVLRKKI